MTRPVRKKKRPLPPLAKPLSIEELRTSMPAHMTRNDRRRLKVVLEQHLDATLATRFCGECTACCTAMGVGELGKPPLERCSHVTAQGCVIYSERPPSCREFLCAWRIGIGTDDQRPDRMGIVLAPTGPNHPAHPAYLIYEVWPDAVNDNADVVAPYLMDIASRVVVVLVRDGVPKSFAGPDNRILALRSFIAEMRALNEAARKASAY